jgi:NADH-quinone oxidoreductase subunit N
MQSFFFERILAPLYSSSHAQNYYGIVLYLFLAMALCSLLATLAYLFSLSSVQDSEKRSEYECGFEPFDSATRLPFDVHFYLVGILFLIFDVEIALLFPWVLGLKTSGWFGFYLMLGFILLLAIGFLYEWKRGALIWPSRQQEQLYVAKAWFYMTEPTTVIMVSAAVAYTYFNPESYYIKQLVMWTFAGYTLDTVIKFYWKSVLITRQKVPMTAYVNVPTERIEKKLEVLFKKVASRIKKTNLRLNKWRYKTFKDYIGAAKFTEQRLTLHKKAINFYLQRIAAIAGRARSKHFYDEKKIAKFEKSSFDKATSATVEYRKVINKYKALSNKLTVYRKKNKLTAKKNKVIKSTIAYIEMGQKPAAMRENKEKTAWEAANIALTKLTARRKLNTYKFKSRKPFMKNKSNLKRGRKAFKNKKQFTANKKSPKRLSLLLPIPAAAVADSYPVQFFGDFLPELTITVMLAAILSFMAIELGAGRSKKNLALESLSALRQGLSFVIGLYLLQLFFGSAVSLFNGYLVVTMFTTALKLLTVISGRFILSSSEQYVREHQRQLLEYPVVLTLAILFMLLLVGSGHLISAFLALVGFSLNLYVLVLFDATAAIAREAGIKYFYLSTVSSGLMLYSIFLVFIVVGSGHLYEIGHFLSTETELLEVSTTLLQLALTMLFVGLFFKLSAFPGHLWAAEVYEGSPDPITAFFMLPVKVAVLGFVIQLIATAFEPVASLWQPLLAISAAASLVWGCLAALAEPKTKRFLAYASINQIGFLLVGLSSASLDSYRTTMFYLLLYAIMNIGFLVVFLHARREDGKGLLYLTDFRGFGQKYTQHSWSVAMILLSMAGIPPLAGFFGKYYLLLQAQEQQLYGLVIIGLATSLVSTYYYLRLIKIMWFEGRDGMTAVTCELTWQQTLTLRLCEWTLWIFIVHSGVVIYSLNTVVEALVLFNDFYTK